MENKASFVRDHHEVMGDVREMLISEGVLSRKVEHKKK